MEIVFALITATFITIPVTIAMIFVYVIAMMILNGRVRKKVMLENNDEFFTDTSAEREIARKHPKIYNANLYGGGIILGIGFLIYVVAVLLILYII